MKKFILFVMALFAGISCIFAQNKVEMADTLRSEGKIYVVVLVMLVIFAAVAVYLFILDRKVSKLEKDK
ncbi:CcmD family protein [Sphingobacterium hotanense]|uniref:CcmD family protein n=1 Tax=Sphingobacterium hotanense TaxID=649196 RepID=UPI0021A451EB|nr:CcmD family protein [Sphingobacterium hotanense]MCT1525879.1 CcmD family protein [Sphingobacterium hotanense]